jgi:L-iditol 2-dehydrogenase
MQSMALTALNQMQSCDIPAPKIVHDTDVLLKLERVGVCGSDVHYYETGRIGSQVVTYPFRVGHECSATVAAVGRAVKNVKPGDPVAVDPATPCYHCDQCLVGRENTCRNLGFLGTPGQAEGCLCEYIVMPAESLFPTHGKITLDQAALCEPLSVAVYSVKRAGLTPADTVAILGAGPIGLCTMLAARAAGVKTLYMTEKLGPRLAAAQNHGADWVGNPDQQDVVAEILKRQPMGIDMVFECAGQQETIDQGVNLLKPGGKFILTGIPRESQISMSVDLCRRKELTLINIRRQNRCVQPAIDLLASGKINADFLITHRFPFARAKEAFDLVADYRDGVIKAMIDF